MMANEEKMEQKQEGRKHNLKVFVIMIPLLIVSLLGLIVFSRENFKESVKEYFAVKYLESNGFQAPFLVCLWNNSFEELELLLKDTSEKLYKAYKKELEWDMTYERLDTNFHSMDKALAEFYLAGIR